MLKAQKQFYYTVEYEIQKPQNDKSLVLYGLVSLNRSSESGVSSAYFGFQHQKLPHFLQSIYLKNDWIHRLVANGIDRDDVDIINDSIHSPILLNPDVLRKIEDKATAVNQQEVTEHKTEWTLDMTQDAEQLILVWDESLELITEITYSYHLNTEDVYSRKWKFNYLTKKKYTTLASYYKRQNQLAQLPNL